MQFLAPMEFPLGDRADYKADDCVERVILEHFQDDLAERLDIQQMFLLIDGVIPFEACLYYQVLPLFVDGSRLILGMVSPDDGSGVDYVRRILFYHNYSLVPRKISSDALQGVLTAYLKHTGNQQAQSAYQPLPGSPHHPHRNPVRTRSGQQRDQTVQPTLIVDSPEELMDERLPSPPPEVEIAPPPQIPVSVPAAQQDIVQEVEDVLPAIAPDLPAPDSPPRGQDSPPQVPPLLHRIKPLELQSKYLSSPVETLTTLPPRDLLQELLARVLFGGIGRLYFERQMQFGRVLWSQNGVLQSILDRVEFSLFQGVINELKLMAHLSLIPIEKPTQTEIERLYQQGRILLRFRFMPSAHGEEATLQVLRGAALRFYQQQQLSNLERDALTIARQLQVKVNQIRDRALSETGLPSNKDALPALSELLRTIEAQIGTLQSHDALEDESL